MLLRQGRRQSFTCLTLLFCGACAHAGTMGNQLSSPLSFYKNLQVSAAGGASWYTVPDTYIVVTHFETDTNQIEHIATNGAWKVGIGYPLFEDQLKQQPYLNGLLFEVNVYQTSTTLNGSVWQFGFPEFNNFNFSAPVTSTRLMFDFKPSLFTWNRVTPYPILGIGATWNTIAYNEMVTAAGINPASAQSISNNTSSHIAWDAGVGISVEITDKLSATAEYIYAFLGNSSAAHITNNGVDLPTPPLFSLQTQSILFGLNLKL